MADGPRKEDPPPTPCTFAPGAAGKECQAAYATACKLTRAACATPTVACPQDATPRSEPDTSCTGFVCRQVTLVNVAPERGDDCHEVVCKNVAAVFDTVRILGVDTVVAAQGLLGVVEDSVTSVPGVDRVRRVLVKAAFWCEPPSGSGGGPHPTGCQRVLNTPVANAGFGADVDTDFNAYDAYQCAWVRETATGSTHVSERERVFGTAAGASCTERAWVYAAFGTEVETYHVQGSCA